MFWKHVLFFSVFLLLEPLRMAPGTMTAAAMTAATTGGTIAGEMIAGIGTTGGERSGVDGESLVEAKRKGLQSLQLFVATSVHHVDVGI